MFFFPSAFEEPERSAAGRDFVAWPTGLSLSMAVKPSGKGGQERSVGVRNCPCRLNTGCGSQIGGQSEKAGLGKKVGNRKLSLSWR